MHTVQQWTSCTCSWYTYHTIHAISSRSSGDWPKIVQELQRKTYVQNGTLRKGAGDHQPPLRRESPRKQIKPKKIEQNKTTQTRSRTSRRPYGTRLINTYQLHYFYHDQFKGMAYRRGTKEILTRPDFRVAAVLHDAWRISYQL